MANAGRILIIPKGDYNANATYEMLDLVSHNGTSWVAKKTVAGIEPSNENSEYWQNMFSFDTEAVPTFHKIEVAKNVVTSTELKYTGVSITIPANSYVAITAEARWSFDHPSFVGLSTSDTLETSIIASNDAGNAHMSCTYCKYITAETTFYLWAKYQKSSANDILLRGFYVN